MLMFWANTANNFLKELSLYPKYQVGILTKNNIREYYLVDTLAPQIIMSVEWMNFPDFQKWIIKNKEEYLY